MNEMVESLAAGPATSQCVSEGRGVWITTGGEVDARA